MTRLSPVLPAVFMALAGCMAGPESREAPSESVREADLATAESFVDAFYSFNPERLRESLRAAATSQPAILFYQGWAEGARYTVVNRAPCEHKDVRTVSCSITVDEDLINTLGVGFDVTDTFVLLFSDAEIVAVDTESDDPEKYHAASSWVRENRHSLIDEPCRGYFDGGPTPGKCAQAMVQGFAEFVSAGEQGDIE
jgi:hypothetical protein